jgi:chemotaxis protein MotB
MADDFVDYDDEDDEDEGDSQAWLATFGDMMTLLLCFFVMLLAMATLDQVKFLDVIASIQTALGVDMENPGDIPVTATVVDEEEPPPMVSSEEELLNQLQQALQIEGLEDDTSVEATSQGILLRIRGRVLYEIGDATLRERAFSLLNRLSDVIGNWQYSLMIEGHTDNSPIQTPQFPSNWELSTARAISAMRYLVDRGVDARRIGVAGYADQRPIQLNDTAESRTANRRIEFLFVRSNSWMVPTLEEPASADAVTAVPDVGAGAALAVTPLN